MSQNKDKMSNHSATAPQAASMSFGRQNASGIGLCPSNKSAYVSDNQVFTPPPSCLIISQLGWDFGAVCLFSLLRALQRITRFCSMTSSTIGMTSGR